MIVRLASEESAKLPSRGQVAVRLSFGGRTLQTVLEPDGRSGHWFDIPDAHRRAAGLRAGVAASFEIAPTDTWPEPHVPEDVRDALDAAPGDVWDLWQRITPMARWEWVRWVNATRNPDTRRRRVDVTISKLGHGKRRPCCFNLSSCTDPELSKSGVLVAPALSAGPGPVAH